MLNGKTQNFSWKRLFLEISEFLRKNWGEQLRGKDNQPMPKVMDLSMWRANGSIFNMDKHGAICWNIVPIGVTLSINIWCRFVQYGNNLQLLYCEVKLFPVCYKIWSKYHSWPIFICFDWVILLNTMQWGDWHIVTFKLSVLLNVW